VEHVTQLTTENKERLSRKDMIWNEIETQNRIKIYEELRQAYKKDEFQNKKVWFIHSEHKGITKTSRRSMYTDVNTTAWSELDVPNSLTKQEVLNIKQLNK